MFKMVLVLLAFSVNSALAAQALQVTDAAVRFGPDGKYSGYLVRPAGSGPYPALVVIHEWWGLNNNIRNESRKLAKAGYVALAIDLFGKSTTNPAEAAKLTRGLNQEAATAEMLAATAHLRSQPYVKADRVGSIGWCFGGAQSLILAINDPKLAAAVIYYGKPITDPKQLSKINAAILGIYGEADKSIPLAQVRSFQTALTKLKIAHEFHSYPGAGHAFANPSRGKDYKPAAAKDAWRRTLAFLAQNLKR